MSLNIGAEQMQSPSPFTILPVLAACAFGFESIANAQEPSPRADSLQHARKIANWLDSVAITEDNRTYWPIVPAESTDGNPFLYSGTSGVTLFYIEMHRATGDESFLNAATRGGNWLVEQSEKFDASTNPAFFTGIAGIGFVLSELHAATNEARFEDASQDCLAKVMAAATLIESAQRPSVHWNEVTDVIGGTAGIGFYLIDHFQRDQHGDALQLAIRGGNGLLSLAKTVELDGQQQGLRWMMSPSFPREMPNYSHGTAGICDFLLALDRACRTSEQVTDYDGRFLSAAQQGAAYLESLSSRSATNQLIPHHFPDGESLFYLGWCHGPSGTVRFLDRLHQQTETERWSALADELVGGLVDSGIPQRRPDGFWNNAGLCCGNAGAASFLLGRYQQLKRPRDLELAELLSQDIVARAQRHELENGTIGLSWTQAEHRVRPDFLQAQTGLMQGAAGIGLWFLKLHGHETGNPLEPRLPILPY